MYFAFKTQNKIISQYGAYMRGENRNCLKQIKFEENKDVIWLGP